MVLVRWGTATSHISSASRRHHVVHTPLLSLWCSRFLRPAMRPPSQFAGDISGHYGDYVDIETSPGVTPEAFDTLRCRTSLPILVSFERSWSRTLLASLHTVAAAFPRVLRIGQVDCSVSPELASHYKIRICPTLILFKRGTPVAFLVGPVPAWGIVGTVAQALGVRGLGESGAMSRVPSAAPLADIPLTRAGGRQPGRWLAGATR